MAIAFDAASDSGYKTATQVYSWTHTCTGANLCLRVGVAMLSVAGTTVSGITYNGVALSLVIADTSVTGSVRAELWELKNPSTGANTVEVTLSASIVSGSGAMSFTGVDQTTVHEGANSNGTTTLDTSGSVSVTTTADNDWITDVIATGNGSITADTGQTAGSNITGAAGSGACSRYGPKTPAGARSMKWNSGTPMGAYSIAAAALIPAVAALPIPVAMHQYRQRRR